MVTLKEFINYLYDEIEFYKDNQKLSWTYKNDKRIIFDRIPYSKDQCFRMINQSKFGKEHILLPINYINIIDTFVRNYLQCDISNIILYLDHLKHENPPILNFSESVKMPIDITIVLYCTYMHPYIYTVSRTAVQLLHRM